MREPIISTDPDALDRIRARLAEREQLQARMKSANAAIRRNAAQGAEAQVAALVTLGFTEAQARDLLTPDFAGRIGFPAYGLTNNNAEIKRLEGRITAITRAQATPDTAQEGPGGLRMEDAPSDNRVRLFFPGKPAPDVRARLKSCGFRWAPSVGAWQAYRNTHALAVAREFIEESP